MGKNGLDFRASQDNGWPSQVVSMDGTLQREFDHSKDLAGEENHRV